MTDCRYDPTAYGDDFVDEGPYTVRDYIKAVSSFMTDDAVRMICVKRHIDPLTETTQATERDLDLAEAEAYYWLSNLPVGGGTVKDVDGNWSHSEGGWQVSQANIDEWRRKYAALREKWDEEVMGRTRIKLFNL